MFYGSDIYIAQQKIQIDFGNTRRKKDITMSKWFTIDQLDNDSYIISEYRHWEETHCYLLNGTERSLLNYMGGWKF